VARFVGSPPMNLLPGDGPLRPSGMAPDAGRTVGFRPEAVRIGRSGDGVSATVERVDVVGEDAHAYLRVGTLAVVARVPASARPKAGDEVGLTVRWADEHIFEAGTGRRVGAV
jgi:ABC-type sugar transport system ATPase subunit